MLFSWKLFIFDNIIFKYFSAFIWLFSSVYPHMQFQIKYMWANFITLSTFIWFLFSVYIIRYGLKVPFQKKIFITLVAFIWFLSSVCHQTWLKATISQKSFITLDEFIWVLSNTRELIKLKSLCFSHESDLRCNFRSVLCEKAL